MQLFPSSILHHLSAERERLPLWLPVCLGLGMGGYFALPSEPPLAWLVAALALALAGLAAARRHELTRLLMLALALAALGALVAAWRTHAVATPVLYGELFYKGVSGHVDAIEQRQKGLRVTLSGLQIEGLPAQRHPRRITLTLKKPPPGLAIGDEIATKAMLFAPPAPTMPGGYDYTRSLYFQGIGGVGFAPSEVQVLSRGKPSRFTEALDAFRLSLAERIGAPMQPENAPVAAALMVGEQSAVSEEVADAMRDAGIYHVLSISGLHMALAAGILYFSLRLLLSLYPPLALRLPVKKIAASLGLAGAFAYLLVAGYPVPAVRSFVMVACVMLAVLADRQGISLYALAWAAVIILLWQPEAVLSASFHLSFAATLAIMALYEHYRPQLRGALPLRRLWMYLAGITLTSLAATLVTTPLVLYHFNRFTVLGLVANTLLMPLASFWIMPMAVLAFATMPFGLEFWPLKLLDYGISLMVAGAKWMAGFSWLSFSLPAPTGWGIALCVLGMLWLCLWKTRLRLWGVLGMALGLCTIALHTPYDLLVSDDASRVALRRGDSWYFIRGTPASFDAELWMRSHGKSEDEVHTLKDWPAEGAPVCDAVRCVLQVEGLRVVVGKSRKRREGLCEGGADILISDAYINPATCPQVAHLFDRRYVDAYGAVGLRFTPAGVQVERAADYRGKRPWVVSRESMLYQKPEGAITTQ
jgi:competence protein ComEC